VEWFGKKANQSASQSNRAKTVFVIAPNPGRFAVVFTVQISPPHSVLNSRRIVSGRMKTKYFYAKT
jgi:hypothetical protein